MAIHTLIGPSRRTLLALLGIAALLGAPRATAQSLLADIHPGLGPNPSANLDDTLVVSNGRILFNSDGLDGVFGAQLWATDGSAAGKVKLLEFLNRGGGVTPHGTLALPNGLAVFRAGYSEIGGTELYATDGTPQGTGLVVDIRPGSNGGMRTMFGPFGNRAVFLGNDGTHGNELWITDGTAAGTSMVADIRPGFANPDLAPGIEVNGRYVFPADDGVHGRELWVTDGTPAGTSLLADIHPTGDSDPSWFATAGPLAIFAATDPVHGREVWTTDGTPGGTVLARDILPGDWSSNPTRMTTVGNRCYFVVDYGRFEEQLWIHDGTRVRFAADVRPSGRDVIEDLTAVGGKLFFTAHDGVHGRELWTSDGTIATTTMVADLTPGSDSTEFRITYGRSGVLADKLVFSTTAQGSGEHDWEPWVSDGTAAGTFRLADIDPTPGNGSWAEGFAQWQGRLVFHCVDGVHGRELWETDGTSAGTRLFQDLAPPPLGAANVTDGIPFGDGLLFNADDGVHGNELWFTDGTTTGTHMVADLDPVADNGSTPRDFVRLGDRVVFKARTEAHGTELWISDGTSAGTTLLADCWPGPESGDPRDFAVLAGVLYFSADTSDAGREPWKSFGTPALTGRFADLWSGPGYSIHEWTPQAIHVVGGQLLIITRSSLYRSSGTTGTTTLVDPSDQFTPDWNSAQVVLDDELYLFATFNGQAGLWRTDGTLAGTQFVRAFSSGCGAPWLNSITTFRGRVYLSTRNSCQASGFGRELWVSDGTTAGTYRVADINPGLSSSDPAYLVPTEDALFFTAEDDNFGRELWRTDGTAAGTVRIADTDPGLPSGLVASGGLIAVGDGNRVVFGGRDPVAGFELWISGSTPGSTQRLFDLHPGPAPGLQSSVPYGDPPRLFVLGDQVLFVGDDGTTGFELWTMPLARLEPSLARTFGVGCTGSSGVPAIAASRAPVVGRPDFAVELTSARPNAAAVALFNLTRGDVDLGGGCTAYPTLPTFDVGATVSAQGTANAPLPIPADPSLIGLELFGQWLVLDPNGAVGPSLGALSDGLRLVIGRS